MVLLMKSPRSYTCEDVVEIDSHGGPFLIDKILKILMHHGARLAEQNYLTILARNLSLHGPSHIIYLKNHLNHNVPDHP